MLIYANLGYAIPFQGSPQSLSYNLVFKFVIQTIITLSSEVGQSQVTYKSYTNAAALAFLIQNNSITWRIRTPCSITYVASVMVRSARC